VTDWLEEHVGKLGELKLKQFDLLKAVELRKASLLITANELDENGRLKLKNEDLRNAFVLNALTNDEDSMKLREVQRQIIIEEAVIKAADYQFKALVAILAIVKNTEVK